MVRKGLFLGAQNGDRSSAGLEGFEPPGSSSISTPSPDWLNPDVSAKTLIKPLMPGALTAEQVG